MQKNLFTWKQTLIELNDFNCKIEFLQTHFRRKIAERKKLNIDEYVDSLRTLFKKHEKKLRNISVKDEKLIDDILFSNLSQEKSIEV